MQILYLYGFASGPLSNKAQFFKKKFASIGVNFQIYDYVLNPHEFSNMKPSELHRNLHKYIMTNFHDEKITLFGSSFGALLVTWYAHLHPEKVDSLILIAPALQFSAKSIIQTLGTSHTEWEREGEIFVDHYRFGGSIPLKYSFLKDLRENPIPAFSMDKFPVPTIIFQGEKDEVVPPSWSTNFSRSNPKVKAYLLNGDHQLLDHKIRIWNTIRSEFKFK